MAFQTRFANCASTVGTWLTVRDTVAVDTFARLATSRMSTSPLLPSAKVVCCSIRYPKHVTTGVPDALGLVCELLTKNQPCSHSAIEEKVEFQDCGESRNMTPKALAKPAPPW